MSGLKMCEIVIALHEIAAKVVLGLPGMGYAASGIGTAATVRSGMKVARPKRANDKLLALQMAMDAAGKFPSDGSRPPKVGLALEDACGWFAHGIPRSFGVRIEWSGDRSDLVNYNC